MANEHDDEPAVPGVEPKGGSDALRPLGKWIAMDEEREIRASGDTFAEVREACDRQRLDDSEFLFVQPPGFIGGAGIEVPPARP